MPQTQPGAASTKSQYAVKHKETGLFFAGFDPVTKEPIWTTVNQARHYDDQFHAHSQALCFVSGGIRAQKTPVRVAA